MLNVINQVTLINGAGSPLRRGEVLRLATSANTVLRGDASTDPLGFVGVALSGVVGSSGPVNVVTSGPVRVLLEAGLTPVASDTLYVSATTPGRATNVPSTGVAIGEIIDASKYATTGAVDAIIAGAGSSSQSPAIWIPNGNGGYLLSKLATDGAQAPEAITANAPVTNGKLLDVQVPPRDVRGTPGVVGLALSMGNAGGTENGLISDTGNHTYQFGDWQKAIPVAVLIPYFKLAGAGTTDRVTMVIVPHTAVFADAPTGAVGDITCVTIEGAPDIAAQVTRAPGARDLALQILGGDCEFADGVYIATTTNGTNGFLDWADSTNAPLSAVGHYRESFNLAGLGKQASINGAQPVPTPRLQLLSKALNPIPSTNYPGSGTAGGITVLQTYNLPADTGAAMRSFVPRFWHLPTAVVDAGGQLNPAVRFSYSDGGIQTYQNTSTAGAVRVEADSVDLGGEGAYITKIEFIVTNTSVTNALAVTIPGFFQLEGFCVG